MLLTQLPWITPEVGITWLLCFMAMSFVAAGVVKGTLGVGLPLIAVPLLALTLPPHTAISLMAVPVLTSNVWQAIDAKQPGACIKRFLPLSVALFISTTVSVWFSMSLPTEMLSTLVAVSIILAVGLMMYRPKRAIPPRYETGIGVIIGTLAGIMAGVSSLAGPFIIAFLLALRLPRETFVGSISFIYLFSVIPLYASLAFYGRLGWIEAAFSLAAVVPMLLGMTLGKRLRHRLSENVFRRAIQGFLALIAILLIAK